MLDQPAAIVRSGSAVLTHNAAWDRLGAAVAREVAGEGRTASVASAQQPRPGAAHDHSRALIPCLGDGRDAQALADALADGTRSHGSAALSVGGKACTARWATVEPAEHTALIVIEGAGAPSGNQSRVIALQRARIERLLIRQTIIEEGERRRLGRALHDVVAQDLARVRAALAGGDRGGPSISGFGLDGGLALGGGGGGLGCPRVRRFRAAGGAHRPHHRAGPHAGL